MWYAIPPFICFVWSPISLFVTVVTLWCWLLDDRCLYGYYDWVIIAAQCRWIYFLYKIRCYFWRGHCQIYRWSGNVRRLPSVQNVEIAYIDNMLHLTNSNFCMLFSPDMIMRIEIPSSMHGFGRLLIVSDSSPLSISLLPGIYTEATVALSGSLIATTIYCYYNRHPKYYLAVWLGDYFLERTTFMNIYVHFTMISSIKHTLLCYTMVFLKLWWSLAKNVSWNAKIVGSKISIRFWVSCVAVKISCVFHYSTLQLLFAILLHNVLENESLFLVHLFCLRYRELLLFELKAFRQVGSCYYNSIRVCVVFRR